MENAIAESRRTLRDFGLLMGGAIAAIFGLLLPLLKQRSISLIPWAIALVFAAVALLRPMSLSLVHRYWMKFGAILGAINSRIILTIVFALAFTPLALLFKLLRRDVLRLKADPNASTYRIPATNAVPPKSGMEKPF